jgi:transposase
MTSTHSTGIRYETLPGEQAQLDWKENIQFEIKNEEIVHINIVVLLLSYSRFNFFTQIFPNHKAFCYRL